MKKYIIIVAVLLAVAAFFYWQGARTRQATTPERDTVYDTITVRDTVRDTVPVPKIVYRYVDTVWVQPVPTDSIPEPDSLQVPLPMEVKEYRTENYYALIEGYRPRLLRLDVYPQTKIITRTQVLKIKPRWGLGIQIGYGITPQRMVPYIGIGIQYNLLTW